MTRTTRNIIAGLAALIAALGIVGQAAAFEGRNGRIAFTSGREEANDNKAQLYLIKPDGTGLSEPFGIDGVQNRHASFSPDRTKVVFAAGTPGSPTTEEFDLWVHDFETGLTTAVDPNQLGDGLSSDHPAWSPDGGRIAYEQQPVDNSTDRNIMVKSYPSAQPAQALTTGGQVEFKPAWSPDGNSIYYAKTNPLGTANHDIMVQPAAGGTETPVANTTADEYQPAISPDGTRICYTHQSTAGNPATAEIMVAGLPGLSNPVNISQDASKGDINCTWSPDGRKIAYSNGVFGQGRLVLAKSDGTDMVPTPVTDDAGSNNFDGNADWIADGSPECDDKTVRTEPDQPVTLELECTDTGPEYERTDPNGTITSDAAPQHGTLSDDRPLDNPSTVLYTPDPGFTGSDTVTYASFDDFGFGTDRGTVTIQVGEPASGGKCAGMDVTIAGTDGADKLRGTPGADVIHAGPGKDRVRAGGGKDVVCGGPGNDRLAGQGGKDRLFGQGGKDRLSGGAKRDRCSGGPKRDKVRCEQGR